MPKIKRKWCYVIKPAVFDITCDKCDGTNINWSEWEHEIWCYDCQIDTEGTGGIFSGPVLLETVYLLGLNFDRINLETDQLMRLNMDKKGPNGELIWDTSEEQEEILGNRSRLKKQLRDQVISDPYRTDLREYGKEYFKLVPKEKE